MKKAIILLSAVLLYSSVSFAQAYKKGNNLVNIGIGVGTPFFGTGYKASLPVNPTVTYERGVSDEISVGGTVSYASSKYEYHDGSYFYSSKLSATFIGARGSYHFDLNNDNYDVYAGAGLGYVIVSGDGFSVGSGVGYTAFAGGKYYFSNNTAVYAELGYASLALLNIGVALKF